ncbi:MAG: DUF2442 domain-containing protein [Planctomycetes bacterium]|nr:DUF2442 domain-containing protein [Planctomycetota bacterium]MBM4066959.1 DUF2442 domain-containing protein [Planctomycetota bacterium]
MNPRVKAVKARNDYKLEITFSNGEVGVYDCSPLLSFGVFTELKDKIYFQQARAAYGTVVWPHEQDICPDTLYLDSVKIKKSLNKSLQRTGTKSRDSR